MGKPSGVLFANKILGSPQLLPQNPQGHLKICTHFRAWIPAIQMFPIVEYDSDSVPYWTLKQVLCLLDFTVWTQKIMPKIKVSLNTTACLPTPSCGLTNPKRKWENSMCSKYFQVLSNKSNDAWESICSYLCMYKVFQHDWEKYLSAIKWLIAY